ncbi:DUF4240 domain-containing protein [Streptomyces sp. NPDC101178]|uniref:DUF4240 domain-containing protein n=1 Tax=Streptomyces sp. NPDC101178 TaxID=3366124 RepID=UPI00380B4F6F
MREDRFWEIIEELEGCADEASVHELTEILLGEEDEHVAEFQRILEEHLTELRQFASATGLSLTESQACAVVAAGRPVYAQVFENPAAFKDRRWECDESALLVRAAPEVLGFLERIPEHSALRGWLDVRFGSDIKIPEVYEESVEQVKELIEDSLEWIAWWEKAGATRLFVTLDVMKSSELQNEPSLRRVHDILEFSMNVDAGRIRRLRMPGKSKNAYEYAREDLGNCMEELAHKLSLGAIPALPS